MAAVAAAAAEAEQLKAVKEYIAKYNIEDEVSNAVNHAIKMDSDNPYLVISEYLRQFAKDKGDDEEEVDDEDDVMAEGEEPVIRRAGRRGQVAAKELEAPPGWKPPKQHKSAADASFLREVMANNKLMRALCPSDREMLKDAFQKKDFGSGEAIITQGDAGDVFYVLASGSCDISVAGKGSVKKATKGSAFGELALLHNAPRAATVTAEGSVTTWCLDETSFKMILQGKSQTDQTKYIHFLKQVGSLPQACPPLSGSPPPH